MASEEELDAAFAVDQLAEVDAPQESVEAAITAEPETPSASNQAPIDNNILYY